MRPARSVRHLVRRRAWLAAASCAAPLAALPHRAASAQAPAANTDTTAAPGAARFRWQLFSEMQYDANERRVDSPLNPHNVARLSGDEGEWRLFPVVETEMGRLRLRADTRVRGRVADTERRAGDVEAQELVAGLTLGDAFYLAAGRQRLGWGTGLVANPTRLEAQRDAFRLANRTRGTDAVRLEWVQPALTTNLVVSPSRVAGHTLAALRAERTFGAAAASASVVTRAGRDWRAGGDVALPLGVVTLFAEGTVSGWSERPALDTTPAPPPDDVLRHGRFVDVVAGGIWTPHAAVRLAGEYRYQSDNLTRAGFDAFVRTLPNGYARYDPLGMGRHRLFASARFERSQQAAAVLNVFADPVTRQAVLAPALEASGQRVRLEISPFVFVERRKVSALASRLQIVLSAVY
jgi:hypothetical protein